MTRATVDGSYALKLASKPRIGAQNVAIKRLTFRRRGPIRLEFYFTFKPEANELRLSETDVRSIGFLYDLQSGDSDADGLRVMPHVRFLNAHEGQHLQTVYPRVRDYGGAGHFAFHPAAHLTERSPLVRPDAAERLLAAWRPHWDPPSIPCRWPMP